MADANELEKQILTGDVETIKQLTRNIFGDPTLRESWAVRGEVWNALLARLQNINANTSSMGEAAGTESSVAILQFANNLAACHEAGKVALANGFIDEFIAMEFPTSFQRYVFQIMANLSAGLDESVAPYVASLMSIGLDSSSIDYLDVSDDISTAFPIIFMHKNFLRALNVVDDQVTDKLIVLWGSILRNSSKWWGDAERYSMLIKESMELAVLCFSSGVYAKLVEVYGQQFELAYPLFKIFATVLESATSDDAQKQEVEASANLSQAVYSTALSLKENLKRFSNAINDNQQMENLLLGLSVIEELRVFVSFTQIVNILAVSTDYRAILLIPVIEGLIASKKLPAKSKLNIQDTDLKASDFPFLRCHLIDLLTSFVVGDRATQDTMREHGGLAAVLECCVVDGYNPFMKEHAIVCIRYLLEANQENQAFVASMEAKQTANPSDLEEAGYETEIVNGRISIKKK